MSTVPLNFGVPPELVSEFRRWQMFALVIGVAGLLASAVGAFLKPDTFFPSYLTAFLFWLSLSLGALAIIMLQHLTGGAWGVFIRRPLESAMRTVMLMLVLFVPVLMGIRTLYPWSHPAAVAGDRILNERQAFLNIPFFVIRAAVYFGVWLALGYLLAAWSKQQDHGDAEQLRSRMRKLSAAGLILYVYTVTFAAVDWAESIEPHFYSTMWGFLFVAQQGLTAMAFVILVMTLLSRREPLGPRLTPTLFQDLGKLLFMFVMLWAYFAYSQFLIVWEGNLPSEIEYYIPRIGTTWGWIFGVIALFEFLVPFLLLLSRALKRNRNSLAVIVCLLLCLRPLDVLFLTRPSIFSRGATVSWMDVSTLVGIGGLWIAYFLRQLRDHPLLPLNDPALQEALEHGHAE